MAVTTRSGLHTNDEPKRPEPRDVPGTSSGRVATSKPSPYYLLGYLVILALGSLYATISPGVAPPSSTTPLSAGTSSNTNAPSVPSQVSYFASKRNYVNLYFVKMGWFWTTTAFVLLQSTTKAAKPTPAQSHYVQAAIRYAVATSSWIFTTQWLFGPALIDRSFTITGGHCEALPATDRNPISSKVDVTTLGSSMACKGSGGRWRGGHDISGHIFMLTLSSAFLLLELYLADRHSSHPSVSPRAAAGVAHEMTEEEKRAVGGWESETTAKVRIYSRYFVYAVVTLDFWMILMTAIWFHTWPEKLSGLMISAVTTWSIYYLPDFVPQWREIVGGL